MYSYQEISLKPAVFACLTNDIAPPLIALESCSNLQKIRQVGKSLVGYCRIFVSDIISEVVFGPFWLMFAWPKAQLLGQSVSLKFSLETKLESESFEPLIDFLAFLGQKL